MENIIDQLSDVLNTAISETGSQHRLIGILPPLAWICVKNRMESCAGMEGRELEDMLKPPVGHIKLWGIPFFCVGKDELEDGFIIRHVLTGQKWVGKTRQ